MKRSTASAWLAVGITVLSTGCAPDRATPTDVNNSVALRAGSQARGDDDMDSRSDDRDEDEDRAVTYAVIGDVPYEPRTPSALSLMPTLIGAINADPDVSRAIHLGDIKSGSTKCSDAWFQSISEQFKTFADPLVYAIGDNEWTDCHRANNGGYNPLNRLDAVRSLFFSRPGYTLGANPKRVKAQRNYPENVTWEAARVVFSTLHVIGSNNGRAKWFGDRKDTTSLSPLVTVAKPETAAEGASREAEWAARDAANIRWLERTFDEAREEHAKGVVLLFQADMWNQGDRDSGIDFSAFNTFVARLAALSTKFGKPVLIVCGDSHNLRVDVGVPWFSLFNVAPPANVTQIVVDRSIEDDIDWLKLTIDPKSPTLFSWTQKFVPLP